MDNAVFIIIGAALATYATRVGGFLILSRFGTIHYRLEAALDAVPTAVLAALVAPSLFTQSWAETLSILFAGLIATRYSLAISVAGGVLALVMLRQLLS